MVRHAAPITMDPQFYDEPYPNVDHRKRNMTLDLNRPQAKKLKLSTNAPLLSTPDINKLVLPTPELEKLMGHGTGGPSVNSTAILFPPPPTEEQELYVRGFVDALNELHNSSDSSQGGPHHQPTYTNLDMPQNYYTHDGLVIKDEPQTVPSIGSSPPMSPIDMECQERIKLERKRQRNRVAASKCRRRKLERISKLEDKVKILKNENCELGAVVVKLKEHVCMLKEQVMEHVHSGCQIMANTAF